MLRLLQRNHSAVAAFITIDVDPVVLIEDILKCGGDVGLAGSGQGQIIDRSPCTFSPCIPEPASEPQLLGRGS
jgi:hypothetical protein